MAYLFGLHRFPGGEEDAAGPSPSAFPVPTALTVEMATRLAVAAEVHRRRFYSSVRDRAEAIRMSLAPQVLGSLSTWGARERAEAFRRGSLFLLEPYILGNLETGGAAGAQAQAEAIHTFLQPSGTWDPQRYPPELTELFRSRLVPQLLERLDIMVFEGGLEDDEEGFEQRVEHAALAPAPDAAAEWVRFSTTLVEVLISAYEHALDDAAGEADAEEEDDEHDEAPVVDWVRRSKRTSAAADVRQVLLDAENYRNRSHAAAELARLSTALVEVLLSALIGQASADAGVYEGDRALRADSRRESDEAARWLSSAGWLGNTGDAPGGMGRGG